MPTISDKEFGTITLRRSVKAAAVRIRVAPNGTLKVSLPLYTPVLFAKRLINSSRDELRQLLDQHRGSTTTYEDGMQVGKSHSLSVRRGTTTKIERHKLQIIVTLADDDSLSDDRVADKLRPVVIAALRLEAKSYLPKRLAFLAEKYGRQYERVRFSHASSRWGSCSSSGTISLNIALMNLPFELIDYVIIHELAHVKEMNHSEAFWQLVAIGDPNYKQHRRTLKERTPAI